MQNNNNAAAAAPQVVQPTVEVEMTHAAPEAQAEPEAEPEAEAEAEAEVDDQHAEITVKVGDRDVPISEVSEEDQAQMTPDEYQVSPVRSIEEFMLFLGVLRKAPGSWLCRLTYMCS